MKRAFVILVIAVLGACATQEPKQTPVPGEKPVAVVQKKASQPPQVAGAAQPGGAIEWDPNPAVEQISEYRVYRLTGGAPPKLEGTTTTTIFRPVKKGTFYITAKNATGESDPSEEIKL